MPTVLIIQFKHHCTQVAQQNTYGSATQFIHLIEAAHPAVKLHLYTKDVRGGSDPNRVLRCGSTAYDSADIVLIHYDEFAAKGSSQQLLWRLKEAPRRPLVLVLKHCQLPQMEALYGHPLMESEWVGQYRCVRVAERGQLFQMSPPPLNGSGVG